MHAQKRIIYCDDQRSFLDEFVAHHRNDYSIVTVDDIRELPRRLAELKTPPDLVLLDLYHPREADRGNPGFKKRVDRAQQALRDLDEKIKETNVAVLDAWEPSGLKMLKLLRKQYPASRLPVAIFTQKGLVLLNDEELREAEELGADWLIKKTLSPVTEKIAIDRIILRSSMSLSVRAARRYRSLLALLGLVAGLLGSSLFLGTGAIVDTLRNVVIAIIVALASYLFAPLLAEPNERK